jgi:hypothetical protein
MSVKRSQDVLREHPSKTPPPPQKDPAQIFEEVLREYGEPHFPTKKNPVGSLNEPFWAGLYRSEHHILFEPNERSFYEFAGDIYRVLTTHLILDRLSNRLREVARSGTYPFLQQLTATRHLDGAISHLKGQVQKEEAFNNNNGFVHVANGVLDIRNGGINLVAFSPTLISRNLVPIEYNPRAQCPRFKKELLGLLDEEDRVLLQKFMGLFLLGRNKHPENADFARTRGDWEKYFQRSLQEVDRSDQLRRASHKPAP